MTIKFERQYLYEEVWSTPLTKLGKKYGLSDNGLRKVCKALNIPLPKAGHWARVAAGYQVEKSPLSPETDRTEFISHPKPVNPPTPELGEDNAWLVEREKFESDPTNHVLVDLQPKKFHGLLVETRRSLEEKIKEYEAMKIKAEKEVNQPPGRRWEPNFNSGQWAYFVRRGQLLELHRWGMPFRLTQMTCNRGLAIANALFYAAEARGFELIKEKESNRLGFRLENETIYIRISEKLRDDFLEIKNPSKLDQLLGNNRTKVPTGILRLHLSASGRSADIEVSDTNEQPLQDKLNYVFSRMYKLIIRSREYSRKLEERHRQYKEQERIKEENEKIRQEVARQHEAESKRRANLLSEALSWQNAGILFNYIAHLDELVTKRNLVSTNADTYLEWREWALEVAKELDPSTHRINPLNLNSNNL